MDPGLAKIGGSVCRESQSCQGEVNFVGAVHEDQTIPSMSLASDPGKEVGLLADRPQNGELMNNFDLVQTRCP